MQEKNNQFFPLEICQKLFNFIFDSLIARGLKRVTLGNPLPHQGLIKVPPGLGSMEEQQPIYGAKLNRASRVSKSPVGLGSEIQVQFLETEDELENWTAVDELGSSVHVSEQNGPIDTAAQTQLVNSDEKEIPLVEVFDVSNGKSQIQERNVSQTQGKSSKEVEIIFTAAGQARGPKKSISMKDMTEEEKRKQKGKNIVDESLTIIDPEATQIKPRPRFSVVPNINEKSDEFIKSRKEAMKRNYSMEPRYS
ncbi:hypothetical protein SO802_033636 [Lithocarpus litseifolius]|uniref:Uncharacterized protein n=1 Tax=Lithocarpus litseifolius TaxID=425828 RepID=A0AAW2BDS8_9ROSI